MLAWLGRADGTEGFEETALVHLDAVYRSALRFTHNRAEAEDLVQETYLRAWRGFRGFNPGTNCRAWLLTIQRNAFLNRLRREGREVLGADAPLGDEENVPAFEGDLPQDSPENVFLRTVVHGDVDRALKGLPLAFREAVMLVDLEGLSYKEAAQVMSCPVGTVMSRLARGRGLLRRALVHLAHEHGYSRGSP